MPEVQIMQARDSVSAKMAHCFITLNGKRYNFMQAIEVEINIEKVKSKVPIMGSPTAGNKSTGMEITGKATFHFNTSIFDNPMMVFQNTGEDFYFDMQLTNEDPTSTVGRRTVIAYGCNLDEYPVFRANAEGEHITAEIPFTVERLEIPEQYAMLDGME